MAKKARNFKKSEVNLDIVQEIEQNQEKVLKLKEKYTIDIVALKDSINNMFDSLQKHGKKFDIEKITVEINALPTIDDENIRKITSILDQQYQEKAISLETKEHALESLKANNIMPLFEAIQQFNAQYEFFSKKISAIFFADETKPLSYHELKGMILPYQVLRFEAKAGIDIKDIRLYEERVEKFYDMYEALLSLDEREDKKYHRHKDTEIKSYSQIAKSFIFDLFGLNANNEKNTIKSDSQSKQQEVKASESNENSEHKKSSSSSWWNVNLDFSKWWKSSDIKEDKPSQAEAQKPSTDEQDSENSEDISSSSKVPLSDKSVTNNIHAGYQKVVEYGVEMAKARCFAAATVESIKVTSSCMLKRDQAVNNHLAKSNNLQENKTEDDKSDNAKTPENAVVISSTEKGLTSYNFENVDSIEETVKECHKLLEESNNLAKNCNYMFSMATSIDKDINTGLQKAVFIEAEVSNGQTLISTNGIEITFYNHQEPNITPDQVYQQAIDETKCSGDSCQLLIDAQ